MAVKPHFRYIKQGRFWALYRSRDAVIPMITGPCPVSMYRTWIKHWGQYHGVA